MEKEKLQKILDKHCKWLNDEEGGERANLSYANLSYTNLAYANLEGAKLRGTKMTHVNLTRANLVNADLSGANLSYANLEGVNLAGTNLDGAGLSGAYGADTILNLQCPEEGSFIAWKGLADDNIAKLLIPEDAKRSSATSRKCRASKAVVLAIYSKDGKEISEGRSGYDHKFIYRVGETVYPDSWDEDRWNECSNGIHFFITRKEAEEY